MTSKHLTAALLLLVLGVSGCAGGAVVEGKYAATAYPVDSAGHSM